MLIDLQDIIGRIKNGDQAAFRIIVEKYKQQAFSLAFRILCDEEEARDIVQDSFLRIWQKIDTYKMDAKFSTWMFRIVANRAIDRVRQMKRHDMVKLEKVAGTIDLLKKDQIMEEISNAEIAGLIRWLAEGLPEKQHMVFVLRDIQGLDSEEVQHILDMSDTSVKSNLYHARATIREKLLRELK